MKKTRIEKGRIILWGIVIAVVILLLFLSLGFGIIKSGSNGAGGSSSADNYASLPEKCRPPAGQDLASWKEHLGHHAETQDCLNYFN